MILHWENFGAPVTPLTSILFECRVNTRYIHSRFPITRFPVTRPPFYERVTVPHNEQMIDPSSPTTTEWITGVPWVPKAKTTFTLCSSESAYADRVHLLCESGTSAAPNWGMRFTTAFGAAAVPIGATGVPKFFQCRNDSYSQQIWWPICFLSPPLKQLQNSKIHFSCQIKKKI